MDAPQIDAMIDSTRCFWSRLRCLFLFSWVEIDVANLKSSIISPHFLINHWCWKSKPISNSYRKLFPYTLARLWTRSLWMQFTLAIEEISLFIVFRWRLRVFCFVLEKMTISFLTQVMLSWYRTAIRLVGDHQGRHGPGASCICCTILPSSS